jgi:transcriptional regulator with XRE-family HTH domain
MPRKKQPPTDFGERLATIRKARGLTQVQLAEAADTTQRAISYYETEAGFPPMPAVIALAQVLRVSTDELMGIEEPKDDLLQDDPETRRLWKKFQQVRDLPEKDQRAVIRLVNSLAAASRGNEASQAAGK